MSPDTVLVLVLAINGLWVLIVLVAVLAGWWNSRKTRRKDGDPDWVAVFFHGLAVKVRRAVRGVVAKARRAEQ